jgi:hypothetical protein
LTAPRHDDTKVNFGTPRPGTALGGLEWRQLALLIAGGACLFAATQAISGPGGAIIGTAAAGAAAIAALARPGGRLPMEWARVAAIFSARRLRSHTHFRHCRRTATPSLPRTLANVRILELATDRGPVGLIRDRERLIVVMAVTAEPLMLAGDDEILRRRMAWASILAGMARTGSVVDRIQWIARSRPLGPRAASAYLPTDSPDDLPAAAVASYVDAVEHVRALAREIDLVVALGVTLRRRGTETAARAALDAATDFCAQTDVAGIGAATILDASQVAAQLRVGMDPDAGDRYAASPHGAVPLPPDPADPGPMAIDERWGSVRCDGAHHAAFWISQWPRGDVPGDVLVPLVLAGPPGRTVAVVMAPQDAARAAREVEQARVRDAADDDLRERAGFLRSIRRSRQQDAVAAREHELADGHAAYRMAGFVTVTAAGDHALEVACTDLAAAAALARCEARRLWGAQSDGVGAVLPLCRGL